MPSKDATDRLIDRYPEEVILQAAGRIRQAKRKIRSGGRPKSPDRCPCGLMTAARAKARGHRCEEE